MKNRIIECLTYAFEHGTDIEEVTNWKWLIRATISASKFWRSCPLVAGSRHAVTLGGSTM